MPCIDANEARRHRADVDGAAILGTTDAMKSGLLKGQDARNAVDGLTKAKAGLDVALIALRSASAAASAASAASGAKK